MDSEGTTREKWKLDDNFEDVMVAVMEPVHNKAIIQHVNKSKSNPTSSSDQQQSEDVVEEMLQN